MIKNNQSIYKSEYGDKYYFFNGQFHRVDGPAIEYTDGSTLWYHHGYLHRINGPAIEWVSGDKSWYYHGEHINCSSQKEFERLIKLKALW